MRGHAKAPSAGSSMGRGRGLGRIFRGALATRDASRDADGSGAPSSRGRVALLSLAALAFAGLVLFATPAFASKQVTQYFGGGPGGLGGELSGPSDVAVNTSGAGPANAGDIYVIEERNNRVSRFDENGNFISAWGANVLTEPTNEMQSLSVNATAGTYTLSFEGATTTALSFDASRFEIESALRELPAISEGFSSAVRVSVSGESSFALSFEGKLAATSVPQITVDASQLTGTATTATTTQGSGQYEVCTVAADCRSGIGSGVANESDNAKNGSLARPQSIAVDEDTGNVYVADTGDRRVNEYTGDGTFIRSFGWGVDASTPGEGFEVCPASDRCTYGIDGSGVGQLGKNRFFSQTLGIAVSPPDGNAATGTVFLADPENRRIDTYGLDGTNPAGIGSEATFEENQPRRVAVDSRGIVYASNSKNSGEIERYDSQNANGGGVGFLEPIAQPPLLEGPSEEATKDLEVDPDSDGAGPEVDTLYVLRASWSSGAVVQQFGPTNAPGLTAAPTAVDETHGAEAGFERFPTRGLGLDTTSGRLYVSSSGNVSGQGEVPRVYVLDEVGAPAATLDPVTQHDAHSATFTGTVNPNGALTGYHFEYVDDASFQASGFENAARVPLADPSVGHGESPVAVEAQTPHHLIPGTLYHVRLVAKRTFYASEAVSSTQTFTTESAAPVIDGIDATVPGTEEATLLGTINPSNEEVTNYHFEWGTTNTYGNSTPVRTLPSGSEAVAVSEELSGLTPGQTYHFRLRATNATGTATSPDQTFATPAGPPQLPQRGYEIASQYPTVGVPIFEVAGWQASSEDGNSVAVTSANPLAHSTLPLMPDNNFAGAFSPRNLFTRGSDSWQRTEVGLGGFAWSGDLKRFLTVTETEVPGSNFGFEDPRVDPDDQNRSVDLYQWQPDGKLTWISRDPRIPAGTPQTAQGNAELATEDGSGGPFTMSTDGRTVVFKSRRQLLDADTTPVNRFGEHPFRLYKWEDGQLSFIGVRPDGSVPTDGSELGDYGYLTSDRYAVSRDGSRVVFTAHRRDGVGSGPGQASASFGAGIYVQTDGQPTVEATKEEGVPPLPAPQPYSTIYRGAAADDSRVFFTSASRFTPDSGATFTETFDHQDDLYVYDVAANKLRDLTPRLDGIEDPSVDPPLADRARVLGVVANSEDGKRVYFVAEGAYPTAPNPEGELPQNSAPNLYMAELDSIDGPVKLRFVTTLGSEDKGDWQASWVGENGPNNVNNGKTALASADGSVLGFASLESLTGQPLGGTEQLFVYNAERDRLECASCPSNGTLPVADVNGYSHVGQFTADWQGKGGVRRWVSSDGTVFFTTLTPLLPADENTVTDVYEFREGQLRLVTTGTGTTDSVLSDASVDGSTVFFNTRDALAPQDKEPGINKIYAARVGGGFPYTPPPAPCDFNAGACEGPQSTAPETPGAGTAAFEGPGNPKPRHHRKKRRHRRHHARHHHHRTAKHNRRASR